jgi:hypothetical protein
MADEQRVRGKHEDVGEVVHSDGRREVGIITDRHKVALAVSNPRRNRWPDEPEESFETEERDGFGRFLIDHRGRRLRYDDTGKEES